MYREIPSNGADNAKHILNNLKYRATTVVRHSPAQFVVNHSDCSSFSHLGMPLRALALTDRCFHQAANREVNKTSITSVLYAHLYS